MGLFGKDNSEKYLQAALAAIQGVRTPTVEEMRADPRLAKTFLQGKTGMSKIKTSPAYKQAALKALTWLQSVATQGGLTDIDRARLNDIREGQETSNRGAQEAILSSAAERGVGGSGLEMAQRLIAQQEGAGRANRAGLDVAAQAQQRALDALEKSGQIGERMGAQDFAEQAQAAEAQDAIDRFNTANKQNVETGNVGTTNDFTIRNKDLFQRDFENQARKAEGAAGVYGRMADAETAKRKTRYGYLKDAAGAGLGLATLGKKAAVPAAPAV